MFQYKLACSKPFARNAIVRNAIVLTLLSMIVPALFAQSARATSDETAGDTFPASVTPTGEFAASGTGEATSISADGRYVTFLSSAENLGEEGPPGVKEAYVKDLHTGALELVSRANGTDGEPASESAQDLFISGDGHYVIFSSTAPNLVEGVTTEGQHVYRRDLETGETTLVDRVSGVKGAIVTREAVAEALSADDRYVVFSADVEDLEDSTGAHAITNGYTLYVRDLETGTTTTVGRAGGPSGAIANEPSIASSISSEGRYVAFESAATNLVPGMTANTFSQVYLRDLQTDTTTLLSKTAPSEAAPAGEPGNASSELPILVGTNGCEVAFDSEAGNLYSFEGQPLTTPQVYLTNLCSTPAQTILVSRADGEAGAPAGQGNAATPRVFGASADGRYILFSALSSLLGQAGNTSRHLYLRDLQAGETTLVDRAGGSAGAAADSNPNGGAIAANGCRAVFSTEANNLVEPEPNGEREIYVRQLAPCNEEPEVTPTSLDFGTQALDTIGVARTVTVTAGSEALQIQRVQASGSDPSDFIVTDDECTGETLQPEEKCSFVVRFAPGALGPRSASVILRTAPSTDLEVNLTGASGQLPAGEKGTPGEPGRESPQDAAGQPGTTGAAGAPGSVGAPGAKGARGSRGPTGRDARVTCRLAESHRRITCTVAFAGKRATSTAQAKLTKNGLTYARGSLAALRPARTIQPGAYILRLTWAGHALEIPVRLR